MLLNTVLMDKFQISDQDVNELGTSYYGFVNRNDSSNLIMKAVISGAVTSFTYACSNSDYATNWTNRASLNYFNYNEAWISANLN